MVHSNPSYDLPANYSDYQAYHHYSSQLSQSSSPSSDGSSAENPDNSTPCSIVWVNTLETAFTFLDPWALSTTQVYPLGASTSLLEAPKDGKLDLFSYCDEGTSHTTAPNTRPDHVEISLGYPRATESSSGWIHGVEGYGRNGPDFQIYLTPSPAAEHFPQPSEAMHNTPSPATTSTTSSDSSQHVNWGRTEVEREIERNDAEKNSIPDDSGPTDLPYSHLIAEALKAAPDRKRTLQEIYSWFEQNTSKGRDQRSKGWQNSIRHNLSMNAVCNLTDLHSFTFSLF